MFIDFDWVKHGLLVCGVLLLIYLARINYILNGVPREMSSVSPYRWTAEQLRKIYSELEQRPIDYRHKLPPRLHRRYIVTGGNGMKRIKDGTSQRAITDPAYRLSRRFHCTTITCSGNTS
jgi:hypothetical protein